MAKKKTALATWSHISQIYQIAQRKCGDQLRATGLTQPQYEVLSQIHQEEGIPLTKIGENMNVTGGNVTGIIDRLSRDGLVKRARDKEDRRIIRAHFTAKGRKTYKKATPSYDRFLKEAFGGVSDAELKRLQASLDRVNASRA